MEKTGNIIKARLKALKQTQGWLAEIAGVSINAVSKWTKGGPIARENVMTVAEALGITADQLLKGSQAGAESRSGLVRLSPMERRILALYNGADDRAKVDMVSALEGYAEASEYRRRDQSQGSQQADAAPEGKASRLGLVEEPAKARSK